MNNRFSKLMSKHSDKKLRDVIANRKKYDLRAYKAAVEELEKREIEKNNQKERNDLKQKNKNKPGEFISEYVEKDFFYKVSTRYLIYILSSFVASFSIAALFVYVPQEEAWYRSIRGYGYHRGEGFVKVAFIFLHRLFYMTDNMLFMTLFTSLFFSIGLILWARKRFSLKRIVVYMYFNDDLKILFTKVRHINKKHLRIWAIPYQQLQLKCNEKSSDGMNVKLSYSAIEIYNGFVYIGELLEGHFT